MKRYVPFLLITVSLFFPKPLLADEAAENTKALLQRIDTLEKKVEDLNKKLEMKNGLETAQAAQISEEIVEKKVQAALDKQKSTIASTICQLKDTTLSGFVDSSYTYTFSTPDSRTNTARVFDTEANSFNVQAAKLTFEKLPPDAGGVGFRTDLFFGPDAKVLGAGTAGSTADDFEPEQAYVSLKPPPNCNLHFGCWKWLKIGKFVTMHGAEVIEAKDNWNFSRSLLFGYAIPFTHTGIRAGYSLCNGLDGYFGVVNGWDNLKDNNKAKSIETALGWTATDKLSFNLAGMFGPEMTSNNHSQRALIDIVTTYKLLPKWTVMLNYDYAHDEDAVTRGKGGAWSGIAGYLKYDVCEKLSLISRTEFFSDRKGLRVTSGTSQDLWETTFTFDFRPYKDIITRLEYRHDGSSANIFTSNQKSVDHQDTLGLEAIYAF